MSSTIQFWMNLTLQNKLPKMDDHIHPTMDDSCSFCSLYTSKFGRISHVRIKLPKVEENRSIIFFHYWKRNIPQSEYGRELFKELKSIRQLARQHIKKAQVSPKKEYDKHSKEPVIRVGDLVMLKVDPKFKLDRSFQGPYRVHSVPATCASIQPVNCP